MAITNTKVTRNEVEAEFVPAEVKRGDNAGWKFLELPVTEDNFLTQIVPWASVKNLVQIVKTALRQKAMGWSEQAEEEAKNKDTGVIDDAKYVEVFSKLASSFSARGEPTKVLLERIMDLLAEMSNLDLATPEGMKRAQEIANEVKDLQLDIQLKKRKTKEDEEAETAATGAK